METRRDFLRTTIVAAATATLGEAALGAGSKIPSPDRMGVLCDLTVCIGCRSCEAACRKEHGLSSDSAIPAPGRLNVPERRRPNPDSLTVVNEYKNASGAASPTYVKVQCMHCDYPACESACIVGAIAKEKSGPVLWDTDKCIGCRYCMVACPFQIPSFQYNTALKPDIVKCDFCDHRTQGGGIPACVEICPVESLTYGRRSAMIEIAMKRIENYPDRYRNHIYGEFEAGGTSYLYLAKADFKDLEFPSLKGDPMPGTSESIQHGIFAYFVPPISLYSLLGGLMWINKNRQKSEEEITE
ncbi:MAG: 4Fe-4S dicluster domain-containing protein [bacterium]